MAAWWWVSITRFIHDRAGDRLKPDFLDSQIESKLGLFPRTSQEQEEQRSPKSLVAGASENKTSGNCTVFTESKTDQRRMNEGLEKYYLPSLPYHDRWRGSRDRGAACPARMPTI